MMIGIPNPNALIPITKLKITNEVTGESFYVLYNPESYTLSRSVKVTEIPGVTSNAPSTQYSHGDAETLTMDLFFDTYNSGKEAGGSLEDLVALEANSLVVSPLKMDVREYTSKIYDLMEIEGKVHEPPKLKIEWKSLQFRGYLISCTQKFTKFCESGAPVRATLSVTFKEFLTPTEAAKKEPKESPDTAKYRVIHQGDSLWALSAAEYGSTAPWRVIAEENAIENPRLLDHGGTLRLPAL